MMAGYKTYVLAFCALGIMVASWMGYLDRDIAEQAVKAMGFGAIFTMRLAIGGILKEMVKH